MTKTKESQESNASNAITVAESVNKKHKKSKHDLLNEDTKPYYYLTPSNIEPPEYDRQRHQHDTEKEKNTETRWQKWRRTLMGSSSKEDEDRYFEIGGSHESLNSTDNINAHLTESEEKLKFTQKSYLALAIISTVFFNIPVGIIAIVCSLKAAKAYKKGNKHRARKFAHCSVVLSLISMVVTVVAVLIVVIYVSAKGNKNDKNG